MTCKEAMDLVYDSDEGLPLFDEVRLRLHVFFCARCRRECDALIEIEKLRREFIPASPHFEESIARAASPEDAGPEAESLDAPAGFSFRSWVIAGCFIFVSLSTVFLGLDFINVARDQGSSFLVPVGITIGVVLSCYGALFIGSHLNSLSARFKIR